MIPNAMIANKETVKNLVSLSHKITQELIEVSEKLFKEPLTNLQIMQIRKMDLKDKQWLLKQYKQEINFTKEPDLSNLY
jgi:hypothetical protein